MRALSYRSFKAGWLAVLAGLLISTGVMRAQNVSTDPVGAISLTLKGASDTLISLPFHRPVALETQVQAITGNIIAVPGTANISANQFQYQSGNQTNTYYVQFTSGNNSGMFYTVTSNDSGNITIDNNGDANLTTAVVPGDTFRVIPYWTLNTTFPNGQGIYPSPNLSSTSSILLPQQNAPGINLSAGSSYFYYNGTSFGGAGWMKTGNITAKFPDVILPPDSCFIVRNPTNAADTQLTLVGAVPMSSQSVIVNNLRASLSQDNAVALPLPVNVTLAQSGLFPNVIAGSSSLVPVDELLVFDPTSPGFNKSATATYFYYTGSSFQGAGWYKVGDLTHLHNNDQIFQPGEGFIIRRAARVTAGSTIWNYAPGYLTP